MDSKGVTAFDVVLHDGAVARNKKRKRDGKEAIGQSALAIDAVRLATMFLAPRGAFITKVFRVCLFLFHVAY
jgi:AdoMet-dependent rRNA methyltransferase SPB1